jgi:cell division septum initiation protein DivIVA
MNKIYFSKVFKGYSPEEVEAFIIKLNTDFQQKQQECAAEAKRLNNEIEEIKQRFEETLSTNERLVGENKELTAANEKLLQENQELENQVRQLTQEKQNLLNDINSSVEEKPFEPGVLFEADTEIEDDLTEDITELPAEKPQNTLKTESLKSEDYRRLCEQMGEKLLIADKRAQEIINEAKQEAERIVENAIGEANIEVRKLIAEAKNRAEIIYSIFSEYEKKQVFISAGLEQARKHISEAISEVRR